MQKTYQMTLEGKLDLEKELERLTTVVRNEINEALKFARSNGDLSENADYSAAIEARNHNEDRIAEIEEQLNHCEIVKANANEISIGSTVELKYINDDEDMTIYIVGATEADYFSGKISNESPLGKALIGHKKGDKISFEVNGNVEEYKIISIKA
ncbi:MAG: transcription elongation factor GreA [Clostridia bacterium]|nr:transcription elongation factor GreA [Clostridia bacterium]